MSLSILRDAIIKKLGEETDKLAQSAIDMRVHPEMRSDAYAMVQVDRLAEARALAKAARIVTAEYKRLTEAPERVGDDAAVTADTKPKKDIYGS